MRMGKILSLAATMAMAAIGAAPAAQARVYTDDERDAIYQQCYTLYLGIGGHTPDDANAYCYPRAYENENPTPGDPSSYGYGTGGNQCYSWTEPCNPHFRPK